MHWMDPGAYRRRGSHGKLAGHREAWGQKSWKGCAMARRRRSRCATAAYGPAPAEALTGWRKAKATTVTPFPGFDIVAQHAAPNMVATRDEQEGERDERGEFRGDHETVYALR